MTTKPMVRFASPTSIPPGWVSGSIPDWRRESAWLASAPAGEADDMAAGLAHGHLVGAVEGAAALDDDRHAADGGGDGVQVGDLQVEEGRSGGVGGARHVAPDALAGLEHELGAVALE